MLMLDKMKMKKDSSSSSSDVPDHFLCSISLEIMDDPVICSDGHTYERGEITRWLEMNSTSPKTNGQLSNKTLIPNHALKAAINKFHLCSRVVGEMAGGPSTRNKTKKARQSDDSSVLLEVEQRVEADCAGKTMQLFVRTISNNTISLKMDPSSTVADLMDQIYKSEGIKVNQQRLIYAGKQLDANMTLQHYGIQPSSVIHLILRLLGGQSSQMM